MDCSAVVTELASYHLDLCDPATQAAIDEHLPTCPSCVRAYLSAKRVLSKPTLERPRPHVRERLRAEVARTFAAPVAVPETSRRFWQAAKTPVPLYKSAVVAVALAAAAVLVPRFVSKTNVPVAEAGPYVDSSRAHPDGFTVY